MADLPPPYSPAPVVLIVSEAGSARPASPPPSYEAVLRRDRAVSVGATSRAPASQSLLLDTEIHLRRLSASSARSSGSLAPLSASRSAPAAATATAGESDAAILARVFSGDHRALRRWAGPHSSLGIALHETALAGRAANVRALLQAGSPIAFVDSRAPPGRMPQGCALHAALRGGAPELAAEIADAFWERAVVAAQEAHAADPYETATAQMHRLLDARDGRGCTPLHLAADAGATEAVQALLFRGAAVEARDTFGRTALHMAARYGHTDTAALLLLHGADGARLLASALWTPTAPAAQLAELGSQRRIEEVLRPLVAASKQQGLSFQSTEAEPAWDGMAGFNMPGMESSGLPGSTAAASTSTTTLATPRTMAQRSIPRDTQSMLHSPQYQAWRRDCDVLLAEHRAQKERNRLADVPSGMRM